MALLILISFEEKGTVQIDCTFTFPKLHSDSFLPVGLNKP